MLALAIRPVNRISNEAVVTVDQAATLVHQLCVRYTNWMAINTYWYTLYVLSIRFLLLQSSPSSFLSLTIATPTSSPIKVRSRRSNLSSSSHFCDKLVTPLSLFLM